MVLHQSYSLLSQPTGIESVPDKCSMKQEILVTAELTQIAKGPGTAKIISSPGRCAT